MKHYFLCWIWSHLLGDGWLLLPCLLGVISQSLSLKPLISPVDWYIMLLELQLSINSCWSTRRKYLDPMSLCQSNLWSYQIQFHVSGLGIQRQSVILRFRCLISRPCHRSLNALVRTPPPVILCLELGGIRSRKSWKAVLWMSSPQLGVKPPWTARREFIHPVCILFCLAGRTVDGGLPCIRIMYMK